MLPDIVSEPKTGLSISLQPFGTGIDSYLGTEVNTGELLFVKRYDLSDSDRKRPARFEREVIVSVEILGCSGVVVPRTYFYHERFAYVVFPRLSGHSLETVLGAKGKQMTPSEFAPILSQVAGALDGIHLRKIIHRDVKPENIFLHAPPGVAPQDVDYSTLVSLLDFDNCELDGFPPLASQGRVTGSPPYIAPEIACGDQVYAPAVDVFPLGLVAFESITGQLPYSHENQLWYVVNGDAIRADVLVPGFSKPVADVLARALERDITQRYKTPGEFAKEFAKALA